MNLLFLLYDFYPDFGANSSIIYSLSKAFTECGHEVHVLPFKAYFDYPEQEQWENIQIHRTTKAYDKKQVIKFLKERHPLTAMRLTIALLQDGYRKAEYQNQFWSFYSYQQFRDLLRDKRIDIVINVCYPFEGCLPVVKYIKHFKKTFRWIIYMQDPFATNYYYMSKYPASKLQQLQSEVFDLADKIIVTDLIRKELKTCGDEASRKKFQVLNFPKIVKQYISVAKDDLQFDRHYINCVFVGRFNTQTRNPSRLFQIFNLLKNEKIRLHIIGEEREKWNEYLPDTADNIIFYGTRSKEASMNAELRANILVNVGNQMNNQLPSKLLEYISTGKPIVNLYQIPDCPTLPILSAYPVYLNIYEEQADLHKTLRRLRSFCYRNQRVTIRYPYIQRKYYYSTLRYVSCEFLNLFDELMEDT